MPTRSMRHPCGMSKPIFIAICANSFYKNLLPPSVFLPRLFCHFVFSFLMSRLVFVKCLQGSRLRRNQLFPSSSLEAYAKGGLESPLRYLFTGLQAQ